MTIQSDENPGNQDISRERQQLEVEIVLSDSQEEDLKKQVVTSVCGHQEMYGKRLHLKMIITKPLMSFICSEVQLHMYKTLL